MQLETEDYVVTFVSVTLWLFQVSMTIFFITQLVERNTLFLALFYQLFLLVSAMDSLYFVIVSGYKAIRLNPAGDYMSLQVTFGIKLPQFGLFGEFYAHNSWLSFVSKLSASYLDMLDVILNATIAFNRYSVVASAKRPHVGYLYSESIECLLLT